MPPSRWHFPHLTDGPTATDLIGQGADLDASTLVSAYRTGIFPWPHGQQLPWFSPLERALLTRASAHISRSLRRLLRSTSWTTTVDVAFPAVVRACAQRNEGTWITPAMQRAYAALHELGWAHSVEVWDNNALIGGLYGVTIGRTFCAESMFHLQDNASKVAVIDVAARWTDAGGLAIDGQLETPHLASLGFQTISRREFLAHLAAHRDSHVPMRTQRMPAQRLALLFPSERHRGR